jgi:hypothetical protein
VGGGVGNGGGFGGAMLTGMLYTGFILLSLQISKCPQRPLKSHGSLRESGSCRYQRHCYRYADTHTSPESRTCLKV